MAGGGRTLVVNLVADTSKFGSKMKGAAQDVGGLKGAIGKMGEMAPAAMAAATAAAGAFALKLGVDGIKAAIEDQKAVEMLGKKLENLGLAHEQAGVEAFIEQMAKATGVADDQLRPAYDKLVSATGNVDEANRLLATSLDVSAASGKGLDTVAAALAKGVGGSTTAIGKLGLGIDKATLSSGDFNDILSKVEAKTGGAASEAANTLAGKMQRLSERASEAQEAFGYGFINSMDAVSSKLGDLTGAVDNSSSALESLGGAVGGTVAAGIGLNSWLESTRTDFYKWAYETNTATQILGGFVHTVEAMINPGSVAKDLLADIAGNTKKVGGAFQDQMIIIDDYTANLADLENRLRAIANLQTQVVQGAGQSNYGSTQGGRRPGTAQQGNLDREPYYRDNSGRQNRSGPLDKGTPQIIIQSGIGDPVAIAREVERVLRLQDTRLGPS